MTTCDIPGLMPIADAIAAQLQQVKAKTRAEQIPLSQAANRITATDIISPVMVPPGNNSAMDGYAINWQTAQHTPTKSFLCIGESLAGHPFGGQVKPGECVRITTGALLPTGTDTVVMQENVSVKNADALSFPQVHLTTAPGKTGQHVRFTGEDLAKGDVVIPKGSRLTASHLAMLASVGVAQVNVVEQINVAIMATGDELVEASAESQAPLQAGQIFESNRVGVRVMLEKLGANVIDMGIIDDTPEAIRTAFNSAAAQADWIISSGGVSVGDADFVKQVLEETGHVDFWKVAIKPGKPYAFGNILNTHFSGLPGNPVSTFVTFHQLVVPALRKLAGEAELSTPQLKARLKGSLRKRPGRAEYLRAHFALNQQGELEVLAPAKQGSNMLSGFFGANCFLFLEQNQGAVAEGETVTILPFDPLLL